MSSRATLAILIFAALPVLACAGGETQEQAQEQETEATAESAMARATIQLASLNNSMVSGTAEIAHGAESLQVTLQLSGLEAGQSYAAHVHRGSCQTQGPVAAPLGSIEGTAQGSGSLSVALDMEQFRAEQGMGEESAMEEGAMEEGAMEEGAMEEGAAEEGGMEEGLEEGMEEGMEEAAMGEAEPHGSTGYYVQVHSPDGTPIACGDVQVEMSHDEM